MKGILCLDIATTTGWAFLNEPAHTPLYGSHTVPTKNREQADIFILFEEFVNDILSIHNPHTFVFEAPFSGAIRNVNTARRLLGFSVIAEMCARKKGVKRIREVNNSSVKKHFTGHGRADKNDMIFKCQQKGWNPKDDNEADALALLDYSVSMLEGVQL